jgi:hypothetical protein
MLARSQLLTSVVLHDDDGSNHCFGTSNQLPNITLHAQEAQTRLTGVNRWPTRLPAGWDREGEGH